MGSKCCKRKEKEEKPLPPPQEKLPTPPKPDEDAENAEKARREAAEREKQEAKDKLDKERKALEGDIQSLEKQIQDKKDAGYVRDPSTEKKSKKANAGNSSSEESD
eukprot:Gregarina_sp_Poly_1__10321@NODE_72_length_15994_cov_120_491179_g62_i0_p17_GENE_NODE_72_length_15994_cov_120_491179_g62_i0NODE_72_length_15994_cov_120_491179_g62_i0_p17_ORF_typecomplete_len106_score29_74DUF3450/PF11932_8/0_0029TMCO5/PF14992_6/0_0098Prefoldin_2/PF01920_20/0_013FbpA/PF05833_11/0_0099Cast/PF10174_9/0_018Prefoldin/PF02996_17/0_075JnkSapK_ap_N/PF09744_9/0_1DUF4407/PF14362_6/0_098GBP_C/PF02841_14/0_15SidC_N/PF18219_1/0_16DUF334/PF03904_13/0_21MPS2/PF17060_5/0_22Herpes_UL25/PF01499_16/0